VQRYRQLDRAEVRRQVSAGARHRLEQEGAQFLGKRRQLLRRKRAQIGR
jgi:hypothetical protein